MPKSASAVSSISSVQHSSKAVKERDARGAPQTGAVNRAPRVVWEINLQTGRPEMRWR
jgi:hypothetical protein